MAPAVINRAGRRFCARLPGEKTWSWWRGAAVLLCRWTGPRKLKETLDKVDRAEKRQLVKTLHDAFTTTNVVVVAHYAGLTVAQMTELRRQIKAVGGTVKVAKNRLVKLALEGTDVAGISDLFRGPTLVAFSDDPVAAPKVTAAFAKEHDKLVILGGAMGTTVLDEAGVKSLAALPSLDELRGKLVGLLQAPGGKIAQVVNAPGGQLARVLNAYAEKGAAA